MTLEFKFNAAFPDVELHERGQWRRASGYAGKRARSGCGPEKIPADDGDGDGRLNEEGECCCCCVAGDGPPTRRGEVRTGVGHRGLRSIQFCAADSVLPSDRA